jgi:nucleotide-binding universal stress UspA family protein
LAGRPAGVLAQQCGTHLTLVQVVSPWTEVVRDDRETRAYLERLARELRADGTAATIETRYGETATELAAAAHEHVADSPDVRMRPARGRLGRG